MTTQDPLVDVLATAFHVRHDAQIGPDFHPAHHIIDRQLMTALVGGLPPDIALDFRRVLAEPRGVFDPTIPPGGWVCGVDGCLAPIESEPCDEHPRARLSASLGDDGELREAAQAVWDHWENGIGWYDGMDERMARLAAALGDPR